MTREAQGGLMLAVGIIVTRLAIAGGHTSYVRPWLGILLVIGGVFIGVLGILTVWSSLRHQDDQHEHGAPAVGWLVLVPMLVLVTIAPAPLGAYAAGVKAGARAVPKANFPPVAEATDGAVTMQVREFVGRAVYDPGSLRDVRVRLTGLVAPDESAPSGYLLTRFVVGCCAADATPVQIAVAGDGASRSTDSWVEVTGVWRPQPAAPNDPFLESIPVLDADGTRTVPAPESQYEY